MAARVVLTGGSTLEIKATADEAQRQILASQGQSTPIRFERPDGREVFVNWSNVLYIEETSEGR